MYIFYNLLILPIIKFTLPIIKIFNSKLSEREKSWKASINEIIFLNFVSKKKIWFHSASMGEFEQAKPVIEKLKSSNPDLIIICSFFSPSGFNNQLNYNLADAVVYLPYDFRKNVKYFLNTIKPDVAIFIRYEIWLNYLAELKNLKIPAILISATQPGIRNKIIKFLSYKYYKNSFLLFDEIFTVSQIHTDYFTKNLGCKKVTTASDTRYDRIIQYVFEHNSDKNLTNNTSNNTSFSKFEKWINQLQISNQSKLFILIAGSTWHKDEILISDAIKSGKLFNISNLILIIVPHEPNEKNLTKLKQHFNEAILFSSVSGSDTINHFLPPKKNQPLTLIVDSVGILLRIYKYADAVYIGGGFGSGVHSVAEPAGYCLPLATGPAINNSYDALKLCEIGSLNVIKNSFDFIEWFNRISYDKDLRLRLGKQSGDYIIKQAGSTEMISKRILELINNQPPS